jgi:hypothetical protein
MHVCEFFQAAHKLEHLPWNSKNSLEMQKLATATTTAMQKIGPQPVSSLLMA